MQLIIMKDSFGLVQNVKLDLEQRTKIKERLFLQRVMKN